jgi:UDP-glucose 4-epimerase
MPDALPQILLIGAAGRVGRMVCYHWNKAALSASLIASCRKATALPTGANVLWSAFDGPAALADQLSYSGLSPTAMIVLAGVTPRHGIGDSELEENTTLAKACVRAAQACGISRVLVASSSAVYGKHPEGAAFSETMLPRPLSAYGQAKLAMETALRHLSDKTGLNICALRIGNVAGADALLGPLTARKPGESQLQIDAFADRKGPLRSYKPCACFGRSGQQPRAFAGSVEHRGPCACAHDRFGTGCGLAL